LCPRVLIGSMGSLVPCKSLAWGSCHLYAGFGKGNHLQSGNPCPCPPSPNDLRVFESV
jgi:hypothetical protein